MTGSPGISARIMEPRLEMDLPALLLSARTSRIARWWLNAVLRRAIPFNRPHGFVVTPLEGGGVRVDVPFRTLNRNHIKGLHACCLATAAEYCCGLALMGRLDAGKYRIILKSLRMEYLYQGRSAACAVFAPSVAEFEAQVMKGLRAEGSVLYAAKVPVTDKAGNLLATAEVVWQLKEWSRVRTR